MTVERASTHGPTWRSHSKLGKLEAEETLIVCRCGVDMRFRWPHGRGDVRCFGCGARFTRPGHYQALEFPPWRPPTVRLRIYSRLRSWATRTTLLTLTLTLLLLGLLAIGFRFLLA